MSLSLTYQVNCMHKSFYLLTSHTFVVGTKLKLSKSCTGTWGSWCSSGWGVLEGPVGAALRDVPLGGACGRNHQQISKTYLENTTIRSK